MKQKWQESRNYRRFKDENGEVVRRVITVDGQDVEVSEEVFLAYSQAERRERYVEECERGKVISLDRSLVDGVSLRRLGIEPVESAEDTTIALESESEFAKLLMALPEALSELSCADKELIQAIYFRNMPIREYARQHSVTHRAVIKRRNRILQALRKKLDFFKI